MRHRKPQIEADMRHEILAHARNQSAVWVCLSICSSVNVDNLSLEKYVDVVRVHRVSHAPSEYLHTHVATSSRVEINKLFASRLSLIPGKQNIALSLSCFLLINVDSEPKGRLQGGELLRGRHTPGLSKVGFRWTCLLNPTSLAISCSCFL